MHVDDLPKVYRERAATLEAYAPAAATAFREAAEMAEGALQAAAAELLTPAQAEARGLCHAETVRRAVRRHPEMNQGTAGKILVRSADVPRSKRGRSSLGAIARAAVASRQGN